MLWVINAELRNEYKVFIKFNNGHSGIVDFKSILENDHREIIRSLLDKKLFQTMKVDFDTVCWNNGVDFAPEYLYENIGEKE